MDYNLKVTSILRVEDDYLWLKLDDGSETTVLYKGHLLTTPLSDLVGQSLLKVIELSSN